VRDIRRGLGVALWITLTLIAWDAARIPRESIGRSGGGTFLLEGALVGLIAYGGASLVLAGVLLFAAATPPLRSRLAASSIDSTLRLHAALAVAGAMGLSGIASMGERRGGPEFLSASWLLEAILVAAGSAGAGWGAARAVGWASKGPRPRARLLLVAVLPAIPALLAAAWPLGWIAFAPGVATGPAPAGKDSPDIVLIVADTLRPDALGCYANRNPATPVIDSIAASGALFTDATSQASWTNPSTATLLTSRYPYEHGMIGYRGKISSDSRTLAEVLASRGYETAGFVANLLVSREFGFDRGFWTWDQDPDARPLARQSHTLAARVLRAAGIMSSAVHTAPASDMVGRALRFLDRPRVRPRFLYLHLMDPHDPYTPPPGLARAADPGYEGTLRFHTGTLYSILRGELEVDAADLRHVRALYDAEVAGMDREIGRLIEKLRPGLERGEIVLAFTADHGEEFMEHGGLGHEHTLYQELIHVPLVLSRPGAVPQGAVVPAAVRSLDVAPTLLDIAGLQPEPSFHGRSLVPLLWGEPLPGAGPVFSEEDYIGYRTTSPRMRSAIEGGVKVILYEPNIFGLGAWRRETFDLARDPGESSPLGEPDGASPRIEAALKAWMALGSTGRTGSGDLDPETEHRLKALGYIQ